MIQAERMRYVVAEGVVIAVVLFLASSNALAQSSVRVLRDRTIVWQSGFLTIAAVLDSGTVLEVVQKQGNWYEVRLPVTGTSSATRGFVSVTQVEVVNGRPGQEAPSQSRTAPAQSRPRAPSAGTTRSTQAGLVVSGHFGYERFSAARSFDAVLGSHSGPWFGAGAAYRWQSGLFVGGQAERFQRTGERVFVDDSGDVFKLGIVDKVAIVPVAFTAGYHFMRRGAAPYVGGGAGRYFFKETSPAADDAENFHQQFTSYHVVAGVEWRAGGHMAAAVEVEYRRVPDALKGPASGSFDEADVGGIQTRFKILAW